MTIDVGMEWASQLDIRKSNNAAMEMAIADFFTVRIYLTRLPSLVIFNKLLSLPAWLGRILLYQTEKIGGEKFFLFYFPF